MKAGFAKAALGSLLSASAVAAFLHWGPAPVFVLAQVGALSTQTWLLAGAGILLTYSLRAMRLHCEWHPLLGVSRVECLRIAVFHTFAINLLPMRSGEASYPIMLRKRWKVPLLRSSLSLLWLRAQDISLVAMFVLLAFLPGPFPMRVGAVATLGLLAVFAWKCFRSGQAEFGSRLVVKQRRCFLPAKLAELARRVRAAACESCGGHQAWGYSAAIWVVKFAVLTFLFSALTRLPPLIALCGVLGGEFAAALPVQPALGAGTYEAGVVFALSATLPMAAVDAASFIGAAIAMHMFMLAMSVSTAALLFAGNVGARPAGSVPARSSDLSPLA